MAFTSTTDFVGFVHSIASSPGCVFLPAKRSASAACSHQIDMPKDSNINYIYIAFTIIAFMVLPSLPIMSSYQLTPPTALHSTPASYRIKVSNHGFHYL